MSKGILLPEIELWQIAHVCSFDYSLVLKERKEVIEYAIDSIAQSRAFNDETLADDIVSTLMRTLKPYEVMYFVIRTMERRVPLTFSIPSYKTMHDWLYPNYRAAAKIRDTYSSYIKGNRWK